MLIPPVTGGRAPIAPREILVASTAARQDHCPFTPKRETQFRGLCVALRCVGGPARLSAARLPLDMRLPLDLPTSAPILQNINLAVEQSWQRFSNHKENEGLE